VTKKAVQPRGGGPTRSSQASSADRLMPALRPDVHLLEGKQQRHGEHGGHGTRRAPGNGKRGGDKQRRDELHGEHLGVAGLDQ
jgi:hypothetical protein